MCVCLGVKARTDTIAEGTVVLPVEGKPEDRFGSPEAGKTGSHLISKGSVLPWHGTAEAR